MILLIKREAYQERSLEEIAKCSQHQFYQYDSPGKWDTERKQHSYSSLGSKIRLRYKNTSPEKGAKIKGKLP